MVNPLFAILILSWLGTLLLVIVRPRWSRSVSRRSLILAMLACLSIRLVTALLSGPSVDTGGYDYRVGQALASGQDIFSPHYVNQQNYIPFLVWWWAAIARLTPNVWWFAFVIKAPALLADVALVWYLMSPARLGRGLGGWLLAINPISIAITSILGQFDGVVVILLLMAVNNRDTNGRRAGILYGLSAAVKTWSAFFAPTVLLRTMSHRAWGYLIAGIAAVPLLCFGVYGLVYPAHVIDGMRRAFGYQNLPSDFGTAYLISNSTAGAHLESVLNLCAGLAVLVLALVGARRQWSVWDAIAVGALTLCALSPSTSPQYLVWPVAFLLASARYRAVAIYCTGLLLPLTIYMTATGPRDHAVFIVGELTVVLVWAWLLLTAPRQADSPVHAASAL